MADSKRWLGRDLTVVAVCQLAAGGRQTEDRIRNGLRSRQIANHDQVGCRSIEGRAIYDGVKPNHRGSHLAGGQRFEERQVTSGSLVAVLSP